MVLIKVVELVVDVNGSCDGGGHVELESAVLAKLSTLGRVVVAFNYDLTDLVAHEIKEDAQAEEDHTEDCESDHRRAEGGDRTPSRERLLLELRVLQLLDLLPNQVLLFLRDIHSTLFLIYLLITK